jgi:Putative MetA-pathway of phenol degradation
MDDIKVTDIKHGLGEFVPKPDKPASFAALKETLKKAGYTLASADITVSGALVRDGDRWAIEASPSKQRFALAGADVDKLLQGVDAGSSIEVTGSWQTISKDAASGEIIQLRSAKKLAAIRNRPGSIAAVTKQATATLEDIEVSLGGIGNASGLYFSSIRTTNPGLTVYRGGAVIPRYFYTRQHLGSLKVDRQALRVGLSYTPTPTLQLEAEIPYQHSSFKNGSRTGSGSGFGNLILWGKYRFYRTLETWGDKQAAIRFGLELPTGKKDAPGDASSGLPEFVRQQLSPINGGLAFHSDLSYSQAHRRIIYGGNLETTVRGERDGYRLGHEVRVNTDLEYVLLPLKYQSPGHELFVSLETSYNYRHRGRLGGRTVAGSSASEFYVAPGLQFTVTPRLVIEASFQMPVVRNLGPLALRTDKNLLAGIRYLY